MSLLTYVIPNSKSVEVILALLHGGKFASIVGFFRIEEKQIDSNTNHKQFTN